MNSDFIFRGKGENKMYETQTQEVYGRRMPEYGFATGEKVRMPPSFNHDGLFLWFSPEMTFRPRPEVLQLGDEREP